MTGVEQVIERVDQATALPPVPPSPSQRPRTSGDVPAHDNQSATASFSPDPARRTDRYRLVTPYCLRF